MIKSIDWLNCGMSEQIIVTGRSTKIGLKNWLKTGGFRLAKFLTDSSCLANKSTFEKLIKGLISIFKGKL